MKWLKQMIQLWKLKHLSSEVYYIQGSEVLPHPLSRKEEMQQLEKLQRGDIDARNCLIEHNLRLVVYIAKRYESNPIFMEDLISIGTIGLIKAINTFDMSKNIKLVTYASRCIENEILMYLRKKNKQKIEISFDEPLNVDYDGNELLLSDILGTSQDLVKDEFQKQEDKKAVLGAMKQLEPREQEIMRMRYGIEQQELTQKDIAEKLGISQSYISRLEKRILSKLKQQFHERELK